MKRFIILTCLLFLIVSVATAKQFRLVTDPDQLSPGDEIMLVNIANNRTVHIHQVNDNSDRHTQLSTYPVTIVDNVINADELMMTFILGGQTDEWKLQISNLKLNSDNISSNYTPIYNTSAPEYIRFQSGYQTNAKPIKIDFNGNFADISYNVKPDYHMQYIDSKFHLSDTTEPCGDSNTAVSIFKAIQENEPTTSLPEPYKYYSTTLSWNNTPNDFIHEQTFGDICLKFYQGTGRYQPRTTTSSVRLYRTNYITIELPDNANITSIHITTTEKTEYLLPGSDCNSDPLSTNSSTIEWYAHTPVNLITITNGTAIEETNPGSTSISSIVVNYYEKPQPVVPTPTVSYDPSTDILSIQVLDPDKNPINNASLYFCFTEDEQTPDKNTIQNIYDIPVLLSQVCDPGTYYLWVYASIDGYSDSTPTKYGPFTVEPPHGSDDIEYRLFSGNLTEMHWYIITSSDGSYALGSPDNDIYSACELPISNVGTPHYWARFNEFNETGILEFQYVDGQFIEKRTKLPLQPKDPVSRTVSDAYITIDNTDPDNHIIQINGQRLGFDGSSFGFTDNHNQAIRVLTTGSTINTGIDAITDENNNTIQPIIYYNLQGIPVDRPTKGLYIKHQGNKTTKIIM